MSAEQVIDELKQAVLAYEQNLVNAANLSSNELTAKINAIKALREKALKEEQNYLDDCKRNNVQPKLPFQAYIAALEFPESCLKEIKKNNDLAHLKTPTYRR